MSNDPGTVNAYEHPYLKEFKRLLRKNVHDWDIKKERYGLLYKLEPLISGWKGSLPNLRDIFEPSEIDQLLLDSVNVMIKHSRDERDPKGARFIEFVARCGYKDEPVIGIDGKPLSRRSTPIHRAARHESLRQSHSLFRELFKIYARFDVNYTDESGLTHFHAACWSGHDDVVEKFLELGQDPNDCLVPKTGASPLHLAMDSVASEVAEVLLIGGADPNSVDAKGRTPLHYICSRDDVRLQAEIERLMRLLLRLGSDPNLADKDGSTPLHMIWKNRLVDPCELTETFLKINEEIDVAVQVNVPDKEGNTPLHFSLRSKCHTNKSTVELLLRTGADPNLANADGLTPYWLVIGRIRFYDHDLTKWFFEICAEIGRTVRVDARNRLGQTPLQWAVTNLNVKLVESLLNHGADLSGFCFPTVILKPTPYYKDMFKLSVASSIRIIVENLEKRGYELDRSDALAIVKYFVMYELFQMSEDLYQRQHRLYNDEDIVRRSKIIMMNSSLSLYDLLRLRPEEAEKSLTYTEYLDLAHLDNCRVGEITGRVRQTCAEHLCEKLTRRLFRSWALNFFLELTHYKLPILCSEKIIGNLKNRDLLNVCLAGT